MTDNFIKKGYFIKGILMIVLILALTLGLSKARFYGTLPRDAELFDKNYRIDVVIENVPVLKKKNDVVWVLQLKTKPYPYVYVSDSSNASNKATILK